MDGYDAGARECYGNISAGMVGSRDCNDSSRADDLGVGGG